ncbi:zinc-binding dehydrogenase [Roseibacterium sp. SDUM158017]|uniref:zinc-binding dehydrogenase n=1 Tax=Roseicyclus salinarum TaxID=3036773 RepID=UPI00241550BC|nr:zinc-binding dehydrogenase [Roseibacterium sp. SDUM158017]MDG4647309.1 zinc-binding dehydrogenase [Roseibacterium sp. SDUM158017]
MTEIPQTMRALVVPAPGAAPRVEIRPVPRPGHGEVLVRIAASPINPSDMSTIAGEYGIGWQFPLVPGLEGSGRVVADGGGLLARALRGRAVSCVADRQGLWAEYAVTQAARCVALPRDTALGPAAMSFVNPLTAIALVGIARRGGHWSAVSTAAGGALGRMIRARARARGLKIIDVVRREDQAEALRREGARHVLSTDRDDFDEALAATCRQLRCRMAFDAVGGGMTFRLGEALRGKGEIVLYGGLAQEAARLHPGTMIFKGLTVRGFWLSRWLAGRSLPERLWMARQVTKALQGGFAESRVADVCELADAPEAVARHAARTSAGKILIAPGAEDLGLGGAGAAPE